MPDKWRSPLEGPYQDRSGTFPQYFITQTESFQVPIFFSPTNISFLVVHFPETENKYWLEATSKQWEAMENVRSVISSLNIPERSNRNEIVISIIRPTASKAYEPEEPGVFYFRNVSQREWLLPCPCVGTRALLLNWELLLRGKARPEEQSRCSFRNSLSSVQVSQKCDHHLQVSRAGQHNPIFLSLCSQINKQSIDTNTV